MIKIGRCPRAGGMTVITGTVAGDVIRTFAGCGNSVMTAGTGPGHTGMIKPGRDPGTGAMAVVAGIAAGDMVRCLAGRNRSVVATRAGTGDLVMIETHQWCPDPVRVTVLAHVQGLYMVCRFR